MNTTMLKKIKKREGVSHKVLHSLFRFCGWSAGFTGLAAMSVCPFCGRQGCPVGIAGAGVLGLVCGAIMQWGKKTEASVCDGS